MKIYTEIIYEWIDGGLKEVSSESFDYEGEVISCKGGWKPPSLPTVNVSLPSINVDTNLDEMLGTGLDNLGENMQLGGDTMAAIESGTSQLQTGLDTTVGQAGNLLGNAVTEIGAGIDTGLAFVSALGNKLTEFIHGPQQPGEVKLKKQDTAGDKKKQRAAELAANKAKSRSRSSLKIG